MRAAWARPDSNRYRCRSRCRGRGSEAPPPPALSRMRQSRKPAAPAPARLVRKELGGGSPNALAPLVASWKAARATAEPAAAMPEDSATPVPADPPAAVSDLRRVSAALDALATAVLA